MTRMPGLLPAAMCVAFPAAAQALLALLGSEKTRELRRGLGFEAC